MPMLVLLMPISVWQPAGVIAYGYSNYSPPFKCLLTHNNNSTTLLHCYHHHLHLHLRSSSSSSSSNIPSLLTSLFCFKFFPTNLNCLLTGNSLFFRMEIPKKSALLVIITKGNLFHVWWTYYVLLAFVSGANYFFTSDTQICPSPGALDLQSQPLTNSNVEVTHEKVFPPKISVLCYLPERFWSGSSINKNKAMVEHLQHYGIISSKKVAEVMEIIDRALFVPDGTSAYVDSPMAIGYNATISAPHMHATCLQLLEENLKPGMHALDVGSGTGYLTACFALMVGPQGHAVGVEHIPELANSSIKNIEKSAAAPFLKEGSLSIHVGDGRQGLPEFAPYDAIHVGAAAPEIPQPLLDQLKPGGRMVIPVGNIFQDLKVVDKNEDGSISVRSETSVLYIPLTSRDAQLQGY